MGYAPVSLAWQELLRQVEPLVDQGIEHLFRADPDRGRRCVKQAAGISLDFSRQLIDDSALSGLLKLADIASVPDAIGAMFAGAEINFTEQRPALHVALRRPANQPLLTAGVDVMPLVEAERRRMADFVAQVHRGELAGFGGEAFTDVVNIGIGGSDLGAVMALEALAEYKHNGLTVHCVSNIDGVQLNHVLGRCDPSSTLFIICSKSFTTLETQTNAELAREWLHAAGGDEAVSRQFAAVSTNHAAMDEFGIHPQQRFGIWDWVGGRYSVWSAVGLSVALAVGWDHFSAFLRGAHAMDLHFETTDLGDNLPVLLALIGVWNRNFLKLPALAVLPYDQHLSRFPAFLQQLEMESNGKRVRRNTEPVSCDTCPVVFGEPGSNAQHSFYQLLHQGPPIAAVDFLLPAQSAVGCQKQHDLAIANCLAQAQALAEGRELAQIRAEVPMLDEKLGPHLEHPGSRPSSLIAFRRLDPYTLGALVALYEHKTFVQSVIWDINAFDQWGVELGKTLAKGLVPAIADSGARGPDIVADALGRVRALRQQDN